MATGLMLMKFDTDQPVAVFDITGNTLKIALLKKNQYQRVEIFSYDLILLKKDFYNLNYKSSFSINNEEEESIDEINLTDFNRLSILMIGNQHIITYIWVLFFRKYKNVIWEFINNSYIVFIVPMKFEPVIRNCIIDAFKMVFGKQFIPEIFIEAIPIFFLGISLYQGQFKNNVIFSLENENKEQRLFSYCCNFYNNQANVEFLGIGFENNYDALPISNKEYGSIFEGFKVLFFFITNKYASNIKYNVINMHMNVELGIFTENNVFYPIKEGNSYTFSMTKNISSLDIPFYGKLTKYQNNLFYLDPFTYIKEKNHYSHFKMNDVIIQYFQKKDSKAIINISFKNMKKEFHITLPSLFA